MVPLCYIQFEAVICTKLAFFNVIQPNLFLFQNSCFLAVWNNQIHPPVQTLGRVYTVKISLHIEDFTVSRNCQKQLLWPSHYHVKHTAFMTISVSLCFLFYVRSEGQFSVLETDWTAGALLIHEVRQGNSSWRAAAQQQPLRNSQITSGCKQHWPALQEQDSLSSQGSA